ncbi:MAG: hypothetical protein EXS12_09425 [Phycisphaerales bacterium]|nr:hypothetical protein [Phycisphaerales bacterium]
MRRANGCEANALGAASLFGHQVRRFLRCPLLVPNEYLKLVCSAWTKPLGYVPSNRQQHGMGMPRQAIAWLWTTLDFKKKPWPGLHAGTKNHPFQVCSKITSCIQLAIDDFNRSSFGFVIKRFKNGHHFFGDRNDPLELIWNRPWREVGCPYEPHRTRSRANDRRNRQDPKASFNVSIMNSYCNG